MKFNSASLLKIKTGATQAKNNSQPIEWTVGTICYIQPRIKYWINTKTMKKKHYSLTPSYAFLAFNGDIKHLY